MVEIGRVCVKNSGRDAGRYCVVIEVLDGNYVRVTGPKKISGVRRRRCNLKHLILTPHKLKIKKKASDEEVEKAIKEAKLLEMFSQKIKIKL